MPTQRHEVTQPHVDTLLAWVGSGEIAIPEIQRPFVWQATDVRDLLDSLLRGFPVGYLIAWRNPDVKLKDGSRSLGKRILVDGQQRVTALMAALLSHGVVPAIAARRASISSSTPASAASRRRTWPSRRARPGCPTSLVPQGTEGRNRVAGNPLAPAPVVTTTGPSRRRGTLSYPADESVKCVGPGTSRGPWPGYKLPTVRFQRQEPPPAEEL